MNPSRSFASDNNAGVHPEILKAIAVANAGHTVAYGDDPYTKSALRKFAEHFGNDADVYFVFNGTAANVLGLKAVTDSFHSILCAETSHVYVDECGAPEKFTGCKLIPIPTTSEGKLTVQAIERYWVGVGDQHHTQPKVISIAQATEVGTVYTTAQIRALAEFAHEHGMLLHMDGARISNASASLGLGFRAFTKDAGVDVLSFGGTKNGLLCGEAVIFFNQGLSTEFKYIRKQGMQLASKMRFLAVQFERFLSDELWLRNANHANKMAKLLASELESIPEVKISRPVEANAVFAIIPQRAIPILQQKYFFYVWNDVISEVRWMASFDTTEEDVREFVGMVKNCLIQA